MGYGKDSNVLLTFSSNKRHIHISLISLLFIVVLLFCTIKTEDMVSTGRDSANRANLLFDSIGLNEISASIVVKLDEIRELSLKRADSCCIRKSFGGIFSADIYTLTVSVLIIFFIGSAFYLCGAIKCKQSFIISYIHNLDGMKP